MEADVGARSPEMCADIIGAIRGVGVEPCDRRDDGDPEVLQAPRILVCTVLQPWRDDTRSGALPVRWGSTA
jgi:hypothetical protein